MAVLLPIPSSSNSLNQVDNKTDRIRPDKINAGMYAQLCGSQGFKAERTRQWQHKSGWRRQRRENKTKRSFKATTSTTNCKQRLLQLFLHFLIRFSGHQVKRKQYGEGGKQPVRHRHYASSRCFFAMLSAPPTVGRQAQAFAAVERCPTFARINQKHTMAESIRWRNQFDCAYIFYEKGCSNDGKKKKTLFQYDRLLVLCTKFVYYTSM